MQHIFIVNPTAGNEDLAQRTMESFAAVCDAAALAYETLYTQYAGHAKKIAQSYGEAGEDTTLFAFGGDGTFNEVVNGAYGYDNLSVACIPCGSGNDFVRAFGDEKDFLNPEWILNAQTMRIDLMQTRQGMAAGICSAGLDAAVAYAIPKYKKIWGRLSYKISIIANILKPLGTHMTVTLNDGEEVVEGNFLMTAIANGTSYGGGFCAAPNARVNDGLLEVLLIRKISRLKLAGLVSKYQAGEHFLGDNIDESLAHIVTHKRVKSVHIEAEKRFIINQDGECMLLKELQVNIVESALNLMLPAHLAQDYL